MPFTKVGPDQYVSPSGKHFTKAQVRLYYATGGFRHMAATAYDDRHDALRHALDDKDGQRGDVPAPPGTGVDSQADEGPQAEVPGLIPPSTQRGDDGVLIMNSRCALCGTAMSPHDLAKDPTGTRCRGCMEMSVSDGVSLPSDHVVPRSDHVSPRSDHVRPPRAARHPSDHVRARRAPREHRAPRAAAGHQAPIPAPDHIVSADAYDFGGSGSGDFGHGPEAGDAPKSAGPAPTAAVPTHAPAAAVPPRAPVPAAPPSPPPAAAVAAPKVDTMTKPFDNNIRPTSKKKRATGDKKVKVAKIKVPKVKKAKVPKVKKAKVRGAKKVNVTKLLRKAATQPKHVVGSKVGATKHVKVSETTPAIASTAHPPNPQHVTQPKGSAPAPTGHLSFRSAEAVAFGGPGSGVRGHTTPDGGHVSQRGNVTVTQHPSERVTHYQGPGGHYSVNDRDVTRHVRGTADRHVGTHDSSIDAHQHAFQQARG